MLTVKWTLCCDKSHLYGVNLSSPTSEFPSGIVCAMYYPLVHARVHTTADGGTMTQPVAWLCSLSKHSTTI